MKLRQMCALATALAVAAGVSSSAFAALNFSPFVTTADLDAVLGQHQTIGFAYAGDRFVGSVYFGINNNQLYQTNLAGGNVQTFGAPLFAGPGNTSPLAGEIYVSASLGLGGFGPRDVFAGSESFGTVMRIAHDGSSQGVFASGMAGGVRSINFDPFGLYGNNMIVATNAGNIYRVDASGTPTLLASVHEDAEGITFAPDAFGPFAAGTMFVASEGSGALRAITPGGVVTPIATVPSAEMLSFVPLNLGESGNPLEGFYSAAFPVNVVHAPASDFLGLRGDIVVTGETTHQVTGVHWNGSAFVTSFLGFFPAQPEDGIFVTSAIINPCPTPDACQSVPEPATLLLFGSAIGGAMLVRRRRNV